MDGGIFICYRRQDSAGHAGRLYDRLAARFGEQRVFMDVEAIEPGAVFAEVIAERVARCRVLLVMIGRDWLGVDAEGVRRLHRPDDFVRIEIDAALRQDVWVIPVLIDDTPMPAAEDMPRNLAPLAGRHASPLSSTRFDFDSSQLIEAIERVLEARRRSASGAPAGGPVVSHAEVDFGTLPVGATSPLRTIQIGNGGAPIDAEVRANRPWITVEQVRDRLRLRVDTAVVGRLDGELLISGQGGQTSVPVRAHVVPGPTTETRHPAPGPRIPAAGPRLPQPVPEVRRPVSEDVRGPMAGIPGRVSEVPRPASGVSRQDSDVPRPMVDSRSRPPGPGRPPVRRDDPGRRPWTSRRGPLVAAGLVLLLVVGLGLGLVVRGRSGAVVTPPAGLEDVVAPFPAAFRVNPAHNGSRTRAGIAGYSDRRAEVDALLAELGFSRGFVRISLPVGGEVLSLMIIEVSSNAAARRAAAGLSACREPDSGATFDVPGVDGATGRQCGDAGKRMQEIQFTRDRRLYRLKIDNAVGSTDQILAQARLQAEVSR